MTNLHLTSQTLPPQTRFHHGTAPASTRLALSHHVTLDMMLHQWVPVAHHRTSTLSHSTSSPHVTDITDVQEWRSLAVEPDGKTQVTAPSPESVGHKPGENSTHGVVEDHSKQRCCQVSHGVPQRRRPTRTHSGSGTNETSGTSETSVRGKSQTSVGGKCRLRSFPTSSPNTPAQASAHGCHHSVLVSPQRLIFAQLHIQSVIGATLNLEKKGWSNSVQTPMRTASSRQLVRSSEPESQLSASRTDKSCADAGIVARCDQSCSRHDSM